MGPVPAPARPARRVDPAPRPAGPFRIALIGNPNTGKTTVFNRLCGARAKTSNFPGTTTGLRIGRAASAGGLGLEVYDLPGVYGLRLPTPESRICRDVLEGSGPYRAPDAVVVVVDAGNLARNLVLAAEALDRGLPVVVALNMVDLAQRRGLTFDAARLSAHLGCPVVPLVARRGTGLDDLRATLDTVLDRDDRDRRDGTAADGSGAAMPRGTRPPRDSRLDVLAAWAQRVMEDSAGGSLAVGTAEDTLTERLDRAFTHPVFGMVVFAGVMASLFWTLFALAAVPMDLIEATFARLGALVGRHLPPGPVHDLLAEGIIGGVAGTVVFLPQICLLFFLVSLLEDTGYLARAAFVMDRVLCRFGLSGHAFVPLLTAHACAIPGIMSTRLIPDRRDRLATILVVPMMSCSARLPVYVLLTTLLFADRPLFAGLAFAGCYLLGGAAALVSAMFYGRSILRGRARPMVLELPTYKVPSVTNALLAAKDQGLAFLRTAGTVIMAICIVMWWLNAYPKSAPPPEAVALRAQAVAPGVDARRAAAHEDARLEARHQQAGSFAGRIGHFVQPLFAPLGFDWQLTVGLLTSFLAREVFVSTMAVLVGASPDAEVEDSGVIARIRSARRDDGGPLFTPAASAALLVFFVLAMQCLPTLAVTRRETGSIKWAALQFAYMSSLAYAFAFVTHHALRLAGVS
jgi:ferrous iron transport protein B